MQGPARRVQLHLLACRGLQMSLTNLNHLKAKAVTPLPPPFRIAT